MKEAIKAALPIILYFVIGCIVCVAIEGGIRTCKEKGQEPDITFEEGDRLDSLIAKDSTLWQTQTVITDPEAVVPDKETIKSTGNRVKDIVVSTKTSTQTRLEVPIRIDTINHHDTIFVNRTVSYHDRWIDVSSDDSVLNIECRDSITTYVTRQYRHKFLWWRWGTKGYQVLLRNHNPHSKITYNQTIIPNGSK